MRLLILAIIVLVGAIFLGLEIQKDPGEFSIQVRGWSVEGSVAILAGVLIASFVVFYIAVRLLGRVTPRQVRKRGARRREQHARKALNRGMTELAQGHWNRAEKRLTKAIKHPETAVLGYLAAARAAQERGNTENRDRYLELAKQTNTRPDIIVGITEAQLLIANQQLEQAAYQLRQLYRRDPKNTLILQLLKDCYLESHSWKELAQLMPDLEKTGVVTNSEALHMERNAYAHVLAKAAHTGEDSRALDAAWRDVPHSLRRDKQILAIYIRYLVEHGEGARPETILRNRLNKQWEDESIYLYGLVDSGAPPQQLTTAERWLKRHGDDATLLLTLGRLALRNHLWGKARSYLEKSIKLDPRPETYMLLGKLLEQTGENVIAGECFREGLNITVRDEMLLERTPIETTEKGLEKPKQALATVPPVTTPAPTALAGEPAS